MLLRTSCSATRQVRSAADEVFAARDEGEEFGDDVAADVSKDGDDRDRCQTGSKSNSYSTDATTAWLRRSRRAICLTDAL